MQRPILVAYATKHGSTAEVATAIAAALGRSGFDAEVVPAAAVHSLEHYSGVVLGGSLYMGRWHRDAERFLYRFEQELVGRPLAVFAMGPREMDETAGSRAQLDKALANAPGVTPNLVAIFGGALDPAKLRFPFNRMPAFDARDWDAIEAWAEDVAVAFGYGKPASEARDLRRQLQETPR